MSKVGTFRNRYASTNRPPLGLPPNLGEVGSLHASGRCHPVTEGGSTVENNSILHVFLT